MPKKATVYFFPTDDKKVYRGFDNDGTPIEIMQQGSVKVTSEKAETLIEDFPMHFSSENKRPGPPKPEPEPEPEAPKEPPKDTEPPADTDEGGGDDEEGKAESSPGEIVQ